MSIKGDKQDILNTIGATKTIVGGLPLFKKVNSLSSINNDGDSISFLIDILKTLTGIDDLLEKMVEQILVVRGKIGTLDLKKKPPNCSNMVPNFAYMHTFCWFCSRGEKCQLRHKIM